MEPSRELPGHLFHADVGTARANARRLLTEQLAGQPFSADDLDPSELPVLVSSDLPADRCLDVVTRDGMVRNGLPATYPSDGTGNVVPWVVCQAVGQKAWEQALPGVACRSAAVLAPPDAGELAWFDRHQVVLQAKERRTFEEWYGPFDW